ncbi:transcription elongation factor Elf1 [Hamadaea flava]|uniref:Uncharacterized protein n=1 Tax=Hamadaea flava TaxID=1742688 RepID=A0ABV8LLU8_9ACTN|nr:hypothetical protein [Hamadaea flava]MCP2323905.1 transcription elongation factor Elf1 [Hamadaea flava]
MATWEQWQDAYEAAYEAVPADPPTSCPNCGHETLRLVFTGDVGKGVGYGAFWCDTCLQGISISRAPLPEGAVVRDIHADPADREPKIPNYTLVN